MLYYRNEKNHKMKPSVNTMISFYQQLGKVFYSIAAVDKIVRKEEITELKKIVKKEWLPLEDTLNEFGDDSAYQIEIIFDWLVENNWIIGDVLPDFKNFKKEHLHLFTPKVNSLILKTARAIADSFSGINKLEQLLINELASVLSQ